MKNNYLVQAWLVLMLAMGFGAALAGMQIGVRDRISRNKINETYDQVPNLVPGADKARTEEWKAPDGKIAYKALDSNGEHLGWVIRAGGQGFADKIELLIGCGAKFRKITGLYVLDQKETPALGEKIRESAWRAQFAGRDVWRDVRITKTAVKEGDNEIEAVTGATVSSLSVCNIVNNAVTEFGNTLWDARAIPHGDGQE